MIATLSPEATDVPLEAQQPATEPFFSIWLLNPDRTRQGLDQLVATCDVPSIYAAEEIAAQWKDGEWQVVIQMADGHALRSVPAEEAIPGRPGKFAIGWCYPENGMFGCNAVQVLDWTPEGCRWAKEYIRRIMAKMDTDEWPLMLPRIVVLRFGDGDELTHEGWSNRDRTRKRINRLKRKLRRMEGGAS